MVQISFRVNSDLHALIEEDAAARGQSINSLLLTITTRHLKESTLRGMLRDRVLYAASDPRMEDALLELGGTPGERLPFFYSDFEWEPEKEDHLAAGDDWIPSSDDLDTMVVSPSWRTTARPLLHHALARNCAGARSGREKAAGVFSAFAETQPMVMHNAFHALVAAIAVLSHVDGGRPPRIKDAVAARSALQAWVPLSGRGEPDMELAGTILSTALGLEDFR